MEAWRSQIHLCAREIKFTFACQLMPVPFPSCSFNVNRVNKKGIPTNCFTPGNVIIPWGYSGQHVTSMLAQASPLASHPPQP